MRSCAGKAVLAAVSALGILVGASGAANASLLGQTVTCSSSSGFGNSCSSPTAIVTDGGPPEFQVETLFFRDPLLDIDISGESVVVSSTIGFATGDMNTVTLGDLLWANDPSATITGIANFVVSGVEPNFGDGLLQSDITVGANSVTIDYAGTAWDIGGFVSFDLVTTHSALPESGTLALFGLGLAGLGLAMRRAGSSPS